MNKASDQFCEEAEILLPCDRISEVFPNEFNLYCEHFIKYFPSKPYHAKTTYDRSSRFGGWPEKKSRKTGQPLVLQDRGEWRNRTDTVERHLDHEQWWAYSDWRGLSRGVHTEFFWLGLNMPKRTTFNAIDADNKRYIGWRGSGTQGNPLLPVMEMPLEHFAYLKAIYDAFPDRIWCITSETLGLDIVERHGLSDTLALHGRVKRRLEGIGCGSTEVHPMPGRCKRRPFGEHYRTITAEGGLTTWQDQLAYYVSPGPTPAFRQIAGALLDCLQEQWRCWLDQGESKNKRLDVRAEVEQRQMEARLVRQWLDDDCPKLARTQVAAPAESPAARNHSPAESCYKFVTQSAAIDISTMRGGTWAKRLEEIARTGLPAEDTVGVVAFEMAKWFWWVELQHLAEPERRIKALDLLKQFVAEKHNGYITRWNDGHEEEVLSQVDRCLNSAIALKVPDRQKSISTFAQLREKRSSGQYNKLILLEPIIASECNTATPSVLSPSSLLSILFSVSPLGKVDEPLPCQILDWIEQKRGRNKVEKYATRLCNFLYEQSNWVFLPRDEAQRHFLGYINPKRHHKYNQILLRAGVIDLETYRAKLRPTGYRLSAEARAVMAGHRRLRMAENDAK